MTPSPMLIAVAPNGARRTRQDHPALPITPLELARTAAACAEAGAGMMHLHVRDANGNHTLAPVVYRAALKELEAAVGDTMLIQVTSEAGGIYEASGQIEAMRELVPHCISCGLREFVRDDSEREQGAEFFAEMHSAGTLIQYILYDPEDVTWYETLCNAGVIPGDKHLLLFVLGRYGTDGSNPDDLSKYTDALERPSSWMVCAFGETEHIVTQLAAEMGGHARVGFENNFVLPSGATATDNRDLVVVAAKTASSAGRVCADRSHAESLFG